ncbi:MAG TPA: MBL fold metallo-hydrolase, partial [Zoogloea sp.]|nr:MBL fold metallo-hydrolase [Zoogloea sp.]
MNHSCIVLESPGTRVLCDPWFEGTAFNDGWRLLVEHSHRIDEIPCDYIWLSHEHPDHFSIPTLRRL